MALILDSDARFKLNRVGALELLAHSFLCVIPEAVYDEVVLGGRSGGYEDADAIGQIISDLVEIQAVSPNPASARLGRGERQVLALAIQLGAGSVAVSDDREFLRQVEAAEMQHLSPAMAITYLAQNAVIDIPQARQMLATMQPLTRPADITAALEELEDLKQ